jgi:hypothetical protein
MSKTYNINIENVDLDMLREQKAQLLYLADGKDSEGNPVIMNPLHKWALDGIVNLIDSIQDGAVEQHGLDEAEVFKFKND